MITDGGAMFQGSKLNATITNTDGPALSPPATVQRSPCHTPVPYHFAAIAIMLGLIVLALLVHFCSYRKLSGPVLNYEVNVRRLDVEGGGTEKGESDSEEKALPVSEEKILVIMAGEMKPTFLATPMSSS